jgi:D-alanyl-D-alanine carboxypeptidase
MYRVRSGATYGLRGCVLGFAAAMAALIFTSDSADAWHFHGFFARRAVRAHVETYAPPFASIVVDGNSGAVLYAANADASRHPASLTKIMTLYLLFERLDAGKIRLDTPFKVSEHAAEQAPTKLGLKPGQTIAVEDAIKAVVTKSANDAAVAIAENLAGDEAEFAKLMTQKARAMSMSRTTYVNASGLPNDDQVTTARDQALLGRAIQERFPRYYKYFSTEEFVYRGSAMRNHNHLLGAVGGVDGIKTGYTRASGFNLVTSVHRDGRYIVAVVLGGRSGSERDARMRDLISAHIKEASLQHTAPLLAEKAEPRGEAQPVTFAKATPSWHADPAPAASASAPAGTGSNDQIQPLLVKTISYHTAPAQAAPLAPMPVLVPVTAPSPQPSTSAANRRPQTAQPPQAPEATNTIVVASTEPATVATTGKVEGKPEFATAEPVVPPAHAHGGWLIQVGAFEAEDEAKQHLSAAQLKVPGMLAAADPFTERVQKGDKTFYRARFVGLDRLTAEAACKLLKRSDIECMAIKN